jgi:hypothetical protein
MENKKVEKSLREDSPNASQESKKDESFLLENKNERIS